MDLKRENDLVSEWYVNLDNPENRAKLNIVSALKSKDN